MRVLYLIDSLIAGGAERSLAALAPEYLARGIDLHVAYLYERDNVWKPAIEAAGANAVSLAGSGGRVQSIRRAVRLCKDL
ncbi:MAG TPA: glycosyltransferase family 1 protein, partial [Acidimicrobiia bacterium]|nr:glycosyltransferase family 1 protein [Acidimicrobiia bacterium]